MLKNNNNHIAAEMTDQKKEGKLAYYLSKWYLFLLGLALFVTAAHFYLGTIVPEYLISSTLLIKETGDGGAGAISKDILAELDGFRQSSKIENEIELIKSDKLMKNALSDLGQEVGYYHEGRETYGKDLPFKIIVDEANTSGQDDFFYQLTLTKSGGYSLKYEDKEEELTVRHTVGQQVISPGGTKFRLIFDTLAVLPDTMRADFLFRDLDVLTDDYVELLDVSQVNLKSSVINMYLVDEIPERGIRIMDHLVNGYESMLEEEKAAIAYSTLELIDERLAALTNEISQVEQNVELYKRENDLTDVSTNAEQYLKRANEYANQLGAYELRIDILNSIETYLNQEDNGFTTVPSSLNVEDQTLKSLVVRYNEAQLKRKQMLETSKPENPIVQELTSEMVLLRTNILENVTNLKAGLEVIRKSFEDKMNIYEQRVQRIPSLERELADIKRDQGIKNNLYLYLLQKREESALSLVAGTPHLRVISPPVASEEPINSKDTIAYFGAILMGLFLPFLALTIADRLKRTVESVEEIQEYTATPVLGEIGHNQGQNLLVARSGVNTEISELFRLLVFNLEFAHQKEGGVILVTSSKSGEGKTFISTNLAAGLAQAGKKVIIARLDLRNGRQDARLEFHDQRGVTDYLLAKKKKVRTQDIVYPSKQVSNLHYLPSGAIADDPAGLMRSSELKALISDMKQQFDYVIIDSAPVGLVSDPLALAGIVDTTLYVVRNRVTKVEELKIINDIFVSGKLPAPMIVINDSKQSVAGYGYRYTG